ncbi:MAG TPA: diphosphate--fructose-6-phosphate 1-phosphotransferase [Paludibacter sp.]|nr:diphosphate--fructose-6-phosphate 1-phosphotransferase [Paludibacter sp.]
MTKSPLEIARASYQPKLPPVFECNIVIKAGAATESVADQAEIKKIFPNTYGMPVLILTPGDKKEYPAINTGVILSGGQAPGGHNVISGLFDELKRLNPENKLYGFLGGPSGLVDHQYIELTAKVVDNYRNTGGFDIIGSGRTKLEEEWQFVKGAEICKKLNIKAIVIIGGDDSNTNACVLAEYYLQKNIHIQVIGCPKTIDGDLKNEMIETSFGFDTACKVYSELIGNIQRDASSAKKYWHFIRLMGSTASHIALECALQSQPNICLISEEVEAKNQTLDDIVEYIVKIIVTRSNQGLDYGTVLIPEGLIEFIPAMKRLIAELNDMLVDNADFDELNTDDERREYLKEMLQPENCRIFRSLPKGIAAQLTIDRDPHGNVLVSMIETEKLLIEMVGKRLAQLKAGGSYRGKFSAIHHFFGYEGRCATPTNFDADYTYSLGETAAVLISEGKTGYIAAIGNLTKPAAEWIAQGVPITMMMNMEHRSGSMKPVIRKAMVRLDGEPFMFFEKHREKWAYDISDYIYPGPIQYFGPTEVCDHPTRTLLLEKGM